MNRKIDKDLQEYQPALVLQKEETMKVVPGSSGIKRVVFDHESGKDRAKQINSPREVDMSSIIASGEVVDPKDFMRQFNIRDAADFEQFRAERSKHLFKYVQEHKDEIKQFLAEKVNPTKTE